MKKIFSFVILALLTMRLVAQEGNATLTLVESTLGARKHIDVYSVSMGMLLEFSTKEVLFTLEENQVYKGKSTDNRDLLFSLEIKDLYSGTGTVKSAKSGKTLYSLKDGKFYFGDLGKDANLKADFLIEPFNDKKFQLFFQDAEGKKIASYKGKPLNPNETILSLIALSSRYYGRSPELLMETD